MSNSGFMLKECPFSCKVCGIEFKEACRRNKTMWPGGVPGTIDATFREALERYSHFKPRVLHREPWILQFDEFLQPWEADHLVQVEGALR